MESGPQNYNVRVRRPPPESSSDSKLPAVSIVAKHSMAPLPPVLLRLKLLRPAGIQTDEHGVVTSLGDGGAKSEGLLQPNDRIVGYAGVFDESPCEVSILRHDSDLTEALHAHGMLPSDGDSPCFQLLKVPVRRNTDGLGLVMAGLQVQDVTGR
jgi:hypothetical protein